MPDRPAPDADALIVALKSRSIPADQAISQSLKALEWLQAQGVAQVVFKVCSTFDSTPAGNIGPVADALLTALGAAGAVVCPAFPANGRTVYQGHLFVGDRLLSQSGMERHPLNPMTDPDLRRWLSQQTRQGVGHLPLAAVRADNGAAVLAAAFAEGRRLVIADAIEDDDLVALGRLIARDPLVVGGSAIARGVGGGATLSGCRPRAGHFGGTWLHSGRQLFDRNARADRRARHAPPRAARQPR